MLNERWLWYSWLCSSRFCGYWLSLHQILHLWIVSSISQIEISNILFHVICWFRRAWTCKAYWTTANYKSIRFIVIYCVLISTNVQISDQNALHDSNQVLPCNRFFLFSARSNCPSPENFWLSIFHPPDIFISGKRPKTWFQGGAFYWFWTGDWL